MNNDLLKEFPEDIVEKTHELAEALKTASKEFTRIFYPPDNEIQSLDKLFKILYDSLTPEQEEFLRDKERKLLFSDLTLDQQVYLKQAYHQMWMWVIAWQILYSPNYVNSLEDSRFILDGEPGNMKAMLTVCVGDQQPENAFGFGV